MATTPDFEQSHQRANHSTEWPKAPMAPRWMGWTAQAALVWALAYGAVRVWWAIHGAPASGPLHLELIVFTGWRAVGLCAAAVIVVLALRTLQWHWLLLFAALGICAAHLVACPILLLDLVGALLPGLGMAYNAMACLSRAACLIEGLLVGATAVAYLRRWRSECLFCGRTAVSTQMAKTPSWAWWAAYAAVAGCMIRLAAQVMVGLVGIHWQGSLRLVIESTIFEAAFLVAGTVLPLMLVHSWGRNFPRWLPLAAGRPVPRWLPLGPALVIGCLMTVYFGLTMVIVIANTLTGAWRDRFGSLPLAFFWIAVPGYLLWGVGLLVAAIGYYQVTRPPCRVCGRQ